MTYLYGRHKWNIPLPPGYRYESGRGYYYDPVLFQTQSDDEYLRPGILERRLQIRIAREEARLLGKMSYPRWKYFRPAISSTSRSQINYNKARNKRIAEARRQQRLLQQIGWRSRPMTVYKAPRRFRATNLRTGGFLGIELKFLDCAWNSVTINTSTDGSSGELQPSSGCTNAISIPAQGDGESQRDGRKYTIKSAWLNGIVEMTPLANQSDTLPLSGVFFAMVLDTQANGATIVSENVYVNPSTLTASMLPQPLRNLQNSKRYRILASQYYPAGDAWGIADGASTGSLCMQKRIPVNLSWKGNLVCDSVGTTASVASASDNAIHIIAYTGNVSQTMAFSGKSRVRYVG